MVTPKKEESPSLYLFDQSIDSCQLDLALLKKTIINFIKHPNSDCNTNLLESMKQSCLKDVIQENHPPQRHQFNDVLREKMDL